MDDALHERARRLAARSPIRDSGPRRRHPAATSRTVATALSATAALTLVGGFAVAAPAPTPSRTAPAPTPPAVVELPGFEIAHGPVPRAPSASELPAPHTTTRGS